MSEGASVLSMTRRTQLTLLGGFVAIFGCLLVFGAIAEDVHEQEAIALDALATPFLHGLSSPTLDAIAGAVTNLGATVVLLFLCVVAAALLVLRRHRHEAFFLVVSLLGSVALDQALKLFFHRPRPQLSWAQAPPEFSFPSGHSMNSLVFYVAIALIIWALTGKRFGRVSLIIALVLALVIGMTRIYLGYHYLSDVVGGFLAGAVWLFIVFAAFMGRFSLQGRRPRTSKL